MAGQPGWVPPGVDVKRANTARVYDYWLGGSHNFLASRPGCCSEHPAQAAAG